MIEQYANDGREQIKQLRRGVVVDIDQDTGKETYVQLDIHGAGDGAHLRYIMRVGSASSTCVPRSCPLEHCQ